MANDILKLDPFNNGKLLEGMWFYQKNLCLGYMNKGMLPAFPINLEERPAQDFIRDTLGWAVEELAEADSEWEQIVTIFTQEVYTTAEVQKKIKEIMPRLTEELMDSMHFILEVMLYSNIDPDDMLGYYNQRLKQEGYDGVFMTNDALITGMMYARHLNINNDDARMAVHSAFTIPEDVDEHMAGSKIGVELIVLIERMMWALTKALFKAKNRLKKKYWKENDTETNVQAYQEGLMDAWVYYLVLLDLFQMTDKMIYEQYEKKNIINQERLNLNY